MPELLRMGQAFHRAAELGRWIEMDLATLENTFTNLINAETGLLAVAEGNSGLVGAVGALVFPHYLNAAHLTGQEMFWWVDPAHRGIGGALFDALEQWARDQGASTFAMIALNALQPERVGAIYKRRGYQPAEHVWMRRL